jgi:hypothetical protein
LQPERAPRSSTDAASNGTDRIETRKSVCDRRKAGLIKLLIIRLRFGAHASRIVGRGTMTKTISMRSAGRSWFSNAIGGAWRLVKQSTYISAARYSPLYTELCSLSAQHLPVLVHKRAKYLEDAPKAARWSAELDDFVNHTIWPHLFDVPSMEACSRKRVAEVLDEIIHAEQRRIAAVPPGDDIPHTSRFDTGWVT